jgi:hypothetical protein
MNNISIAFNLLPFLSYNLLQQKEQLIYFFLPDADMPHITSVPFLLKREEISRPHCERDYNLRRNYEFPRPSLNKGAKIN